MEVTFSVAAPAGCRFSQDAFDHLIGSDYPVIFGTHTHMSPIKAVDVHGQGGYADITVEIIDPRILDLIQASSKDDLAISMGTPAIKISARPSTPRPW